MEYVILFGLGLALGMGLYHQWLKRSPDTLKQMLAAVKKGGGSGEE